MPAQTLSDAAAINRVGEEAKRLGDAARARCLFLAATRLSPSDPRYCLSAANMHLKLGDVDKSMRMYETILSLSLTEHQAKTTASELNEIAETAEAGALRLLKQSSHNLHTL